MRVLEEAHRGDGARTRMALNDLAPARAARDPEQAEPVAARACAAEKCSPRHRRARRRSPGWFGYSRLEGGDASEGASLLLQAGAAAPDEVITMLARSGRGATSSASATPTRSRRCPTWPSGGARAPCGRRPSSAPAPGGGARPHRRPPPSRSRTPTRRAARRRASVG